jgi:hypothetical protein
LWLLSAIPMIAYAVALGWRRFAAYLVVANVAANLYPIVLQRYNRARIYRILVSCPS